VFSSPGPAGEDITDMRRVAMGFMVAMALSAGSAMADDCPVPPKPPTYKGDKWAWERAVKRCAERPTEWSRERCIRGIYGER
jgi:hypothetical protein